MTRGRRRLLPVLAVLVAVIVGLLAAADVTARVVAQQALAQRLRTAVPTATTVDAQIRSFPFLGRLLVSGHIGEVDAHATGVSVHGLRFDSIAVSLRGVELDRTQLLEDRRVVLENIDAGRAVAQVTQADLSAALGVPVTLADGRATVTVLGRHLGADLAVRDGRLVVNGAGVSLPALSVVAPLLPCPADAEVVTGRVVLTCDFTGVPVELRTPAQL